MTHTTISNIRFYFSLIGLYTLLGATYVALVHDVWSMNTLGRVFAITVGISILLVLTLTVRVLCNTYSTGCTHIDDIVRKNVRTTLPSITNSIKRRHLNTPTLTTEEFIGFHHNEVNEEGINEL